MFLGWSVRSWAASKQKLSKKEIKDLQKDIDKLKKAMKAIEKLGGKPPKWMLKSLKGLDYAVKAGKGIGTPRSRRARTSSASIRT